MVTKMLYQKKIKNQKCLLLFLIQCESCDAADLDKETQAQAGAVDGHTWESNSSR